MLAAWFTWFALVALASCHPGTWDGKVIMNENGAELPDLSGEWTDATKDTFQPFQLRIFQPATEAAAAPNSSYARLVRDMMDMGKIQMVEVCKLTPVYSYETRHRIKTTIRCEATGLRERLGQAKAREGVVETDGHNPKITWPQGTSGTWQKSVSSAASRSHFSEPKIHKVHVVFMNHYDVGYTDFLNGVDNTYMHKYFPSARATAEKMKASGLGNFTYTTHPWLMQRFLECPCAKDPSCLARNLNNTFEPPLKCPSEEEVKNFSSAAKLGEIAWNAAPFNIQPENLSPELLHAAFDLTRRMDRRFGRPSTRTMSIRDVIYVTRAVLPHLAKYNITGLTIGSNGADFPPQDTTGHDWRRLDTSARMFSGQLESNRILVNWSSTFNLCRFKQNRSIDSYLI